MSQVAEGALSEMATNIQRIRELSVQSTNSTNTSSDRNALNAEVTVLKEEIARVAGDANFNGINMLGADAGALNFQIGSGTTSSDSVAVTYKDIAGDASLTAVSGAGITTESDAKAMIDLADTFLNTINTERANIGAIQNRLDSIIRNTDNTINNLSDSRSRIEDADFAKETANLTKFQLLQQAGLSILQQANMAPQSALSLLG